MSKEKVFSCKEALSLLLDQVDFEKGACTFMDSVGTCIPKEVLPICRAVLEAESNPKLDNKQSASLPKDIKENLQEFAENQINLCPEHSEILTDYFNDLL